GGVVEARREVRARRRGGGRRAADRGVRDAVPGGARAGGVAEARELGAGMTGDHARIGELAERCGVSTRTLRYYEQLGLLSPDAHTRGGARRYSVEAEARVERIREL